MSINYVWKRRLKMNKIKYTWLQYIWLWMLWLLILILGFFFFLITGSCWFNDWLIANIELLYAHFILNIVTLTLLLFVSYNIQKKTIWISNSEFAIDIPFFVEQVWLLFGNETFYEEEEDEKKQQQPGTKLRSSRWWSLSSFV